jgi:hypothetical protein
MYNIILFFIITIFDLSRYICLYRKVKHEKSISLFFHLYFCIMTSFVYKNEDLIYCSYIYFIADSILNSYFKTFKTFNKFHHLLVFILLVFNDHFDNYIINITGIHEFSTIILCLIDMKIINKKLFEFLFPISFVLCRIVIYNIYVIPYIYYNYKNINNETIFVLYILNIMNIGITLKMKLLYKIYKIILSFLKI